MQQKSVTRGEEIEQARVVRWSHRPSCREILPDLKWLHHSPNGGKRDAFTGAQMKALGVKAGFPDLILPARAGAFSGLVIEMKSSTGQTSPAQNEWLAHLTAQGWRVEVCRSADEAVTVICNHFGKATGQLPPLE